MISDPAALIACEAVLDPILEQLSMVLDEHAATFAGPVAEAVQRLRSRPGASVRVTRGKVASSNQR